MMGTPNAATRLALLESLFDSTLAIGEPSREEFIALSASYDPVLDAELRALLAAHASSDSRLALPGRLERDFADRFVGTRRGEISAPQRRECTRHASVSRRAPDPRYAGAPEHRLTGGRWRDARRSAVLRDGVHR